MQSKLKHKIIIVLFLVCLMVCQGVMPAFAYTTNNIIKNSTISNQKSLQKMLSEPSTEDVASVTIGDSTTYYTDFSKAWDTAITADNSKITLLNKIITSTKFELPENKTMSIDLNGKLWTDTNATAFDSTIFISGNLTINDSKGGGGINVQVSSSNCKRRMFMIDEPESAELTINAGNFELNDAMSDCGEIVYSWGKLNIYGGTFKVNDDNENIVTVRYGEFANFKVNGGNFTNGIFSISDGNLGYYNYGGKGEITGGSFAKILLCQTENINIKDILVNGVYFYDSTTDSKITDDSVLNQKYIENVTVKKDTIIIIEEPKMDSELEYQRYTDKKLSVAAQKVNQTESGDITYQWYQKAGEAVAVEIEGANKAEYILPENLDKNTYTYYCVVSLNGHSISSDSVTFEVKEFPQVAGVTASDGDYKTYSSMQLAIDAAPDDSTIKILKRTDIMEQLTVKNRTLIFDLNGKIICFALNNSAFLIENSDITFTNTGEDINSDNPTYISAYDASSQLLTADDDSTIRFDNIWVERGQIEAKNIKIISGKFGTNGNVTFTKQKLYDVLADGVGLWSITDNKWVTPEVMAGNTLSNVKVKAVPVKFTEQSTDKTIYYNYQSSPELSITAQATGEVTDISYQWYSVGTGIEGADELLEGETSTSYEFPLGKSAGQYNYYCLVTCDGYTIKSRTMSVTVAKSGTTLQFSSFSPEYKYGDVISISVYCQATGEAPLTSYSMSALPITAPESGQMALFSNNIQISDAVGKGEDGYYTLKYDTKNKLLAIGQNQITVKYIGDDNLADAEDSVNITLNKKPITSATIKNDETYKVQYNGKTKFTGVPLTLNSDDVFLGDDVEGTLICESSDKNIGTHTFIAQSVGLTGDDAKYYSLDKSAVTRNIEIVPYDITQSITSGRTSTISVLTGNGQFNELEFTGVNFEKITCTFVYQYGDKSNLTHDDIVKELAKLESNQYVDVTYTLTANGNYTGTVTGNLHIGTKSQEFTGSCPVTQNPVYGDTWGDIIKLDQNNFSVTYLSRPVAGTYKIKIEGVDTELTQVPKNGTYNYSIIFIPEDSRYKDIEVQSGTVTIAKREVNIEWGETTLNYTGNEIAPIASIKNKVGDDDVSITVTGEQTNVGTDYIATATSTLAGTDADNYTLPADITTKYSIVSVAATGNVTISSTDNNNNEKVDVGDTLNTDISAIEPAGGTPSYQWKKVVTGITTDIGTNSSYTLTDSDTKGKIYCVVTFSGNTTGSLTSNTIDIAKSKLKGTINITGDTQLGETLSVNAPANVGILSSDYTIAWYRNDVLIDGANTSTYTITKQDLGKDLKVVITAKDDSEGFTGSLTSNIKSVPATRPEKPIITGVSGLECVTLNWTKPFDGGATITGYILTVKDGENEIEGSPITLDSSITSYKVENLKNGIEYSFILAAINEVGGTDSDVVNARPQSSIIISDNGVSIVPDDSKDEEIVISTPPVSGDVPNPPTQVTVEVNSDISDDTAKTTVNEEIINDAIQMAQQEAKKNGTEENGIVIEIKVDSKDANTGETVNNISANLTSKTIEALIKTEVSELNIVSGVVDININLETLKAIEKTLGTDVTVSANKLNNNILSSEAKKLVGNRPVFDFTISGTNNDKVTDFKNGNVTISIPYTLGQNENVANLIVIYIDNEGKTHEMTDSKYDAKNRTIEFTTNHFSQFAVAYKQPTATYTDITNHWAKDSIEYVSALGLVNGTGDGKFSPDMNMTRGMFVTVLGKLSKVDTSKYVTSSFNDVNVNFYYMGYIECAKEKGIVSGKGNNKFAPDDVITREEMAVIIKNYAQIIAYDLPKVKQENIFADDAKISAWAKEAVKALQMAGVLSGKNNNMFDPKGTATRAEACTVIKALMNLMTK